MRRKLPGLKSNTEAMAGCVTTSILRKAEKQGNFTKSDLEKAMKAFGQIHTGLKAN